MKRKLTLKTTLIAALFAVTTAKTQAQAISESFNDITTLAGSGWVMTNASVAVGSTNWFQGTTVAGGGPFDAYSGAAGAYIGANFNNTGSTGTISNWLMMPNRTLRNGDVITFYTRKPAPDSYADRLEVRMSTNGASTSVGTGAATGDYTTLLLSINPSLVLGVYPTTWTQYTITISGLPAPTSGRVAFRYFVTAGGSLGTNSDYIGIDDVNYTPYVCPVLSVAPASVPDGTAGVAYSQSLSQTGALGAPSYAVTAGALPAGTTLSASGTLSGTPTVTGTFSFTVSVSDASGCLGSTAYTLSIACPTYVFSSGLANGTAGVAYSQTVSSTGGIAPVTYSVTGGALPPGLSLNATTGTISGTPTATGTGSFTVTATDANSCMGSSAYAVNVVCPTNGASFTVSQNAFCSNAAITTISGGSPAGGVYSGNGISGSDFDPSTGSQMVTYTLVDPYGCTQTAMDSITVNAAPTVTASADAISSAVCAGGSVTLTGGGADTYVWDSGVTNGVSFMPSATATYMVTGTTTATGCSSTASITVTVNALPTVTATSDASGDAACAGSMVTLTGAGADAYVWDNGVTDGVAFIPTSTTTYMVTGTETATGCSATASVTVIVNPLPVVDLPAFTGYVCENAGIISLSGGTPAGGTYSGTSVTGSSFDASVGMGLYPITYSYTDANGCASSDTSSINVQVCTGINNSAKVETVNVYPNPNSGAFTLVYNQAVNGDLVIRITDLQGKLVANEMVSGFAGTYTNTVDLSAYGKGVYLLEITGTQNQVHKKIIVQ